MLSGLLVGLLGPDADEFLEDISHLHVVDTLHRQIHPGECLDHFVQQVLFVHSGNVVSEPEALDDLSDVLRKAADVGVEVLGQQIRIVQKPVEIQLRRVVERQARGRISGFCRVDSSRCFGEEKLRGSGSVVTSFAVRDGGSAENANIRPFYRIDLYKFQ